MKKIVKILFLILIVSSLFIFTGCENKENIIDEGGSYKLGTYVDIGTNILDLNSIKLQDNTHPKTDWRIFNKDKNGGMWLILSSYLPNDKINVTNMNLVTGEEEYPEYSIKSNTDRKTLLNALKSDFSSLIKNSKIYKKNGVKVKGGTDLKTWVDSWNSNKNYPQLSTKTYPNMEDGLDGMWIKYATDSLGSNSIILSKEKGHKDTLYFPGNLCFGYWLASPAQNNINCIMGVTSDFSIFSSLVENEGIAFRPVVYLPSTIQLTEKNNILVVEN